MRRLGTQPDGYTKSGYRLTVVFGAVTAAALLVVILLTCLQFVCYHDYSFYQEEYEKYDVLSDLPAGVPMTGENSLMSVTEHMMRYLILDPEVPDLQCQILTDEGLRDFFCERDLLHMADCRELVRMALQVRYLCLMLSLFLLVYGRFAIVRETKAWLRATGKGLLFGAGIFFLLAGILAVYIVTDFSTAFIQFHHIFFDNDLWLLDPNESLLINILPEGFFYDVVAAFLRVSVPAVLLFLGISVFIYVKYKDATLTFRS